MAQKAVATNRRRLMQEARELSASDVVKDGLVAAPLEDDLFEWHWTVKGPEGTEFEGGLYHGRLVLPPEYPFKPPELYLLTPSGRFETNTKVCLSISSFHPETWQPSWGIRTALVALTAFFGSDPKGAVGSLDAPKEERKRLARVSNEWKCAKCGYDAKDSPFVSVSAADNDNDDAETTRVTTDPVQKRSKGAEYLLKRLSEPDEGVSEPVSTSERANESRTNDVTRQGDEEGLAVPASGRDTSASTTTTLHHRHQHQDASPAAASPAGHRRQADPHRRQQQQVVVVPLGAETGHRGRTNAAGLSADMNGGDPLWTDRAILVVLLALVACVVRKIA